MTRYTAALIVAALTSLLGALETEALAAETPKPRDYLVTGLFRPVFDHLNGFSEQIDAVIASRCTVVYASGLGALSYGGLPPRVELEAKLAGLQAYNQRAKAGGVGVMLSYLCATSIVNLDTFDDNWDDYFPGRPADFAPEQMLQQDINGANLPSWYGGAYCPADMWNPYWRQYTRHAIKLAVETGHDGVFFDNPTVHLNGNYSPYAMEGWRRFLKLARVDTHEADLTSLRALTRTHPLLWRQFRATESADFIAAMRRYGRSLNPGFILTVNNSLNSWDSFYSQPQGFAYSIPHQSLRQDFVTIEDMGTQPRRQGESLISYASTLRMLPAISNGRPLSICTIDGNYISPPGFMEVAIAECTAHDTAYMVWSCWDPVFRDSNAARVKRYHDFLGNHADLVALTSPVADLLLVWPYENWLTRGDCPTAHMARELSARNLQYEVVTEANLTPERLRGYRVVVHAAAEDLVRPTTIELLRQYEQGGGKVFSLAPTGGSPGPFTVIGPEALAGQLRPVTVTVEDAPSVRAVARRTSNGSHVLHLYNLDVARVDNYHDTVTPAENVRVSWLVPSNQVTPRQVRLLTPDAEATSGLVSVKTMKLGAWTRLEFVVKRLRAWTMVMPG